MQHYLIPINAEQREIDVARVVGLVERVYLKLQKLNREVASAVSRMDHMEHDWYDDHIVRRVVALNGRDLLAAIGPAHVALRSYGDSS